MFYIVYHCSYADQACRYLMLSETEGKTVRTYYFFAVITVSVKVSFADHSGRLV
jgi:hypothetical protein